MKNNPLLQRYVAERSEAAFAELVRLHIDLIYSAALRQVNGDASTAQDVTQAVFTALARKAPSLLHHTSLTGWLYTSTRYISAKARRSEQRRQVRENQAYAMNQILQSPGSDPAWQELKPVLDEAMHALSAGDRDAVLWRYFERRPIAEVGARLGLTEEAARKRIARALDKLRENLGKRGITSTVAALTIALTESAVAAAPTAIAGQICRAAVSSAGPAGASIATLWKMLAGAGLTAVVAGLLVLPIFRQNSHAVSAAPILAIVQPEHASVSEPVSVADASGGSQPSPSVADSLDTNKLVLHIVTADSGKPIPSVELDYWLWVGKGVEHKEPLKASRLGVCEVPVVRETTTKLILVSRRDGFADTRLQWHVDQGEAIPQEYTLRLARAASIGGTVVDADGNPVVGAEVGFNNQTDPSADLAIETSNFGWPFWLATTTDAQGRWQINRMSSNIIRSITGGASERLHLRSEFDGSKPEAIKQMLAGTYEFRLGRGVEVQGSVVETNGQPVSGATVTVGHVHEVNGRQAVSSAKGRFTVAGCLPGKVPISAEATGFAATTIEADLGTNKGPFNLVLQPGKLLRLRVADKAGKAVPNANVWLNTFDFDPENPVPVQTEFSQTTDAEGGVEWSSAPDRELSFDIAASGHMRLGGVKVKPDGQEHLITLPSALTISGTVKDAETGGLIPNFKVIAGWPVTNADTLMVGGHWSTIDRFWLSFTGGAFQHVFEEPVLGGTPNPGYIFKIEAEGYAPLVTRPVALDEGEAQFDVALHAAAATTVTVTLPDGRPAANVEIGLASANQRLNLVPGGFSHENRQSAGNLLLTDSHGQFKLQPDDSDPKIIAAGADGYAETTFSALTREPVLVLQPWGRLEGTLMIEGQAGANCDVALQFDNSRKSGVFADFKGYQVKTDDAGHFAFAQVPPGTHKLVQRFAVTGPNGGGVMGRPMAKVDLRANETTIVTANGTLK